MENRKSNMAQELKQQSEAITQAKFNLLPALLTAFQVKLVTGFDSHELAAAVADGDVVVYRRKPRPGRKKSYSKYTKVSVARIVGFKV